MALKLIVMQLFTDGSRLLLIVDSAKEKGYYILSQPSPKNQAVIDGRNYGCVSTLIAFIILFFFSFTVLR